MLSEGESETPLRHKGKNSFEPEITPFYLGGVKENNVI
jgi:hypothetical protein